MFQQSGGVFRAAYRTGRIRGQDLADSAPVEEGPDTGEMEFDGGRHHPAFEVFDGGCDVDRLAVAQVSDAVSLRATGSAVAELREAGASLDESVSLQYE